VLRSVLPTTLPFISFQAASACTAELSLAASSSSALQLREPEHEPGRRESSGGMGATRHTASATPPMQGYMNEYHSNHNLILNLVAALIRMVRLEDASRLGLSMVLAQSHLPQSVFPSLRLSMVLELCSSAPSWHLVLALAPLAPLALALPLAQYFCASDPALPYS
jgi:hypothetical protein